MTGLVGADITNSMAPRGLMGVEGAAPMALCGAPGMTGDEVPAAIELYGRRGA